MTQYHTVYASAARTATPTAVELNLGGALAIDVVVDVTANVGSPQESVTPKIEAKDPVSGKWYTLLTGTALTAVATTVLRVGPDLTASANSVAKNYVPDLVRITMTQAGSGTITYSVGLAAIL